MRVLHVIPSLSPAHGGPSKALPLMAFALASEGVDVTIVTTDDDGPGRRLPQPVTSPVTKGKVTTWYFPKQTEFYKVSRPLAQWISRHVTDFDVVHIHALFSFTSVEAAKIARKAGVPYIIRPLGVLNSYGVSNRRKLLKSLSIRWREGPLIKDAAAMHFTSQAEQTEVEALGIPIRPRVIPLGIEMDETTLGDTQKKGSETSPYVLFLSRIDPKKNLESLLQAWANLNEELKLQWSLRIAGSAAPEYINSLKALADNLEVSSQISWEGHVEGKTKRDLLQNAEVFALPSHSENFGIAAVEALALGIPTLLGKGVAAGEDAAKSEACLICDPTPESITLQLEKLLTDQELREHLKTASKAFARSEYSLEKMGKSLRELYEEIVSSESQK